MNELFQLSNLLVIPWWLMMIIAPKWSFTRRIVNSSLIFLPITVLYSVLVLPSLLTLLPDLANPQLTVISDMLGTPTGATVAWIHFLAFDLFVGRWIYQDSTNLHIHPVLQRVCLVCTFMAGPFGWLCYIIIRRIMTHSFSLK